MSGSFHVLHGRHSMTVIDTARIERCHVVSCSADEQPTAILELYDTDGVCAALFFADPNATPSLRAYWCELLGTLPRR